MDLTGKKFGVYEIREPLGQGGMGAVYKAFDSSLDRFAAVKVLPAALAADESFVARFQHEAKALAKLRHANLIHIYAVGEAEGLYYFAMELLDGKSLAQVIQDKGRIPEKTAVHILGQVMAGLEKAHEIGMVHRDIKPGNIMIDADGRVVLMDFGLAKEQHQDGLTAAGSVVGTPEYMSPEQAQGQEADVRSDIYALGIVLYEMLTGATPFKGKSAFAILRQHVETAPKPAHDILPSLSPQVCRVLDKMLAKKQQERYQSVLELSLDLVEVRRTPALLTLARLGKKSGIRPTTASAPSKATPASQPAAPKPPTAKPASLPTSAQQARSQAAPNPRLLPTETATTPMPRRKWKVIAPVAAAAVVLLLIIAGLAGRHAKAKPQATPAQTTAPPQATPAQAAPAQAAPVQAALPEPPPAAPQQRVTVAGDKLERSAAPLPERVPVAIKLANGQSLDGKLERFDGASGQFILRASDGSRREVAFADVVEINLKGSTPSP